MYAIRSYYEPPLGGPVGYPVSQCGLVLGRVGNGADLVEEGPEGAGGELGQPGHGGFPVCGRGNLHDTGGRAGRQPAPGPCLAAPDQAR